MLRILTVCFLSFAIFESANGQNSINFSAGVNNSNSVIENLPTLSINTKPSWGYFIGIAPSLQLSDKLQFVINVQYSLKGYAASSDSARTEAQYRYTYIDVIPELEYRILNFLSLGIGVNNGFKIGEAINTNNNGWTDTNGVKTIKSFDFGLSTKAKFVYQNVFGFVRYNIGLSDIGNITYTDINGQKLGSPKQLNRNLQIGIGYQLDL